MVKTYSKMLALGTPAPHFSLQDAVTGKDVSLNASSPYMATVIMFICNHCPYVKHVNKALVKLATNYQDKNIRFIAINPNDIEHYPDDSPENMADVAKKLNYPFPYLFDATQEVAKAYQAACTPDFFIFDKDLLLVYRGQLDDARPGTPIPPTGKDVREALDNILTNQPVSTDQKPSLGCNIKWKDA